MSVFWLDELKTVVAMFVSVMYAFNQMVTFFLRLFVFNLSSIYFCVRRSYVYIIFMCVYRLLVDDVLLH
jgi:hypothetical protein